MDRSILHHRRVEGIPSTQPGVALQDSTCQQNILQGDRKDRANQRSGSANGGGGVFEVGSACPDVQDFL